MNQLPHFNELTPAEAERLAWLLEELGEVQQRIGKILRHGYKSVNPTLPVEKQQTNRQGLAEEIGHVYAAVGLMIATKDISISDVYESLLHKNTTVGKWLHHQEAE